MSFNDNAQLDPSQVQDRRGMGRGTKIGGGIGGGVILLLAALFGINPQLLEGLTGAASRNRRHKARARRRRAIPAPTPTPAWTAGSSGTVNSLNAFWPDYLAQYNT